MLHVMSNEEELESRRQNFDRIKPNTLFNFATVSKNNEINVRYCIAVSSSNDAWVVIELTEKNKKKITNGDSCPKVIISFDEMHCLNVP
ncbi:MAG: hypothetical protein Q8R55_04390 [Candidatus Taylorbacteria bacterium]|nr:hypothetical protein [Candidatus Taylorbacteria bacterium]